MNYAIETLKARKKQVWKKFLKLKRELTKYRKGSIYYKICYRRIDTALKNHKLLDKSINILKERE